MAPPPLQVSEKALKQLRVLLEGKEKESCGIRIGIRTKGCSGLSYSLEYVETKPSFDDVMEMGDVRLFIDPKAILFILGTEMDYVEEKMHSGFVFKNPNEKGRCGCGQSFHV